MLKHSENLDSKEKVKYDLYKILRMSLLLSSNEIDELTLSKFKEASLNIDRMLGEVYEEKLETLFYNTTTLEEEETRLKKLVSFISERIEKRKGLMEDYRSVTSTELTDLDYIVKSGDLDLYQRRLDTIKEYLDSSKLIEVNKIDLEKLKDELVKEYDLKSENEIKNSKIEESLFNSFVNVLYEMDLYSSLELTDIDNEILGLQSEIKESKEQKETFETAFENLKLSGITGDLEIEYASYVENAKRNYYYLKEKEIVLRLYKLMDIKESEYSNLYSKREDVKEILKERIQLRNELGIKDVDYLEKISVLIFEQGKEIENQKNNIDNINVLTERIKLKENRLDELKRTLNKPEILSILEEYSLIDTYGHEDIDYSEVEETVEETTEEEQNSINLLKDLLLSEVEAEEETTEEVNPDIQEQVNELINEIKLEEEKENEKETVENEFEAPVEESSKKSFLDLSEELAMEVVEEEKVYEPNQISAVRTVPTMNFGLSRLKSISVMKRVADMLGVNAKKQEEILVSPEVKTEEQVNVQNEVKVEKTKENTDELFWTPAEFVDMKKETEIELKEEPKIEEVKVTDIFVPDVPIFENQSSETNVDNNAQDIFMSNSNSSEMIFPEPVMPELGTNVLPENKEDKFMWPDNMETFDINGIFPN